MAWSWGGAGSGAASGAATGTMIMPGWGTAIGAGLGGLLGGFSGGTDGSDQESGPSLLDLMSQIINDYSYRPQYTGQTESSLYDLFQRLTGQGNYSGVGNGDVSSIPFDIGLPTTELYDSLTRGIKEDYLGTPGGPEGGRIADSRAYYNNLGIPEQGINQERIANNDLNNLLTDQAAKINESQKDRLTNILNMGINTGQNLYSQNLAQHRANAGLMGGAAATDYALQDAINRTNASSLIDLTSSIGKSLAPTLSSLLKTNPVKINRAGEQETFPNPYGKNYSSVAKLSTKS